MLVSSESDLGVKCSDYEKTLVLRDFDAGNVYFYKEDDIILFASNIRQACGPDISPPQTIPMVGLFDMASENPLILLSSYPPGESNTCKEASNFFVTNAL